MLKKLFAALLQSKKKSVPAPALDLDGDLLDTDSVLAALPTAGITVKE